MFSPYCTCIFGICCVLEVVSLEPLDCKLKTMSKPFQKNDTVVIDISKMTLIGSPTTCL